MIPGLRVHPSTVKQAGVQLSSVGINRSPVGKFVLVVPSIIDTISRPEYDAEMYSACEAVLDRSPVPLYRRLYTRP